MSEPVNLNRFRKQKARAAKKARADQNVVQHGRSKVERIQAKAQTELQKHRLDGARMSESPAENKTD